MSARFESLSITPTVLRRAALALLVLHGATLPVTAHAEEEGAESTQPSTDPYRQATSLIQEKRYEEARQILLELWSKTPAYDVAASLGEVELRLKRYADAMRHLTYAISNPPPPDSEKKPESVEAWFAKAKKHVASYVITTNVEGGLVSVDGIPVAETPLMTPIYVEPGRHVVAVSKSGFQMARATVLASAGITEELPLNLAVDNAPSGQPTLGARQSPRVGNQADGRESSTLMLRSKPNPWILVAGGVVTAGGLITGVAFHTKSNNAQDQAEELRAVTGSSGCYQPSSALRKTCAELLDAGERRDSSRNLASTAFAVGGIAAVGTVLYWFWPRNQDVQRGADVQVSGVADAHRVGLVVSGSY